MLNSSIIDYSVPDHHPRGSSMMVIASQWFPGGGATDIALRSLKAGTVQDPLVGDPHVLTFQDANWYFKD